MSNHRLGKGGKGLGKGGAMKPRRLFKGTPITIALHAKLKATADAAEEERRRVADEVMELTEEMEAAKQRAFEEATHPDRLVELERRGEDPTCRSYAVYVFRPEFLTALEPLNLKTKRMVWDHLHEMVREHYAPFSVEYYMPDRLSAHLLGDGRKFIIHW